MLIEIGCVEALFRYPVKSMRGERLESVELGWHGFAGDRRLALRRMDDRNGFPWLSASHLPELIQFTPHRENGAKEQSPTHVRTPDGKLLPVFGQDLAEEVGRRHGSPVEMMHMRQGVFDEGNVSVIATATIDEIARLAKRDPDARQFRPNVLVRSLRPAPFQEDEWVGGVLTFGEGPNAPAVTVTLRDERCGMLNLDPETARPAPEMLKAVVRANQNYAGVYGAVTKVGQLSVGERVFLQRLP